MQVCCYYLDASRMSSYHPRYQSKQIDEGKTHIMMKKLRGRNLAHPGCLIGVTLGLTVGIVVAGILATMNVSLNTALLVWLGLTLGLGAIGWIVGDRLSSRFPALNDQASLNEPTAKSSSDVPNL